MTDRPNKNAALKTLRSFQRRTVAHVVDRLLDETGSQRYLIADEVGLGKTLVARGVIAELIDHHWDNRRIDIVYMCSNSALARENLRKLCTVGDEHCKKTAATRFTLLAQKPSEDEGLHKKLNFISLTPDTAIRTRGAGIQGERRVLFHLMNQMRNDLGTGRWLSNFLRGQVDIDNWRRRLKWDFEEDAAIGDRFRKALLDRKDLCDDLVVMSEAFSQVNSVAAQESTWRAGQLIGKLRNLLARVCIDALEPDLIILDEFQRFKNLLVDLIRKTGQFDSVVYAASI